MIETVYVYGLQMRVWFTVYVDVVYFEKFEYFQSVFISIRVDYYD